MFKHWKEGLMILAISAMMGLTLTGTASAATSYMAVGSKEESIVQLQSELNLIDNSHLVLDGDFGRLTQSAVKQFQTSHGLVVDGIVGPLTENALTAALPAKSTTPVTSKRDTITAALIKEAESHIGLPYVWGGTSPVTGFDCSGFVQYVFGQQGIQLQRVSAQQALNGNAVSYSNIQPGDLMFFSMSENGVVGHVGMYIGNGQMIAAETVGGISKVSVSTSYWQSRIVVIRSEY